jgi:hypothetical protein
MKNFTNPNIAKKKKKKREEKEIGQSNLTASIL